MDNKKSQFSYTCLDPTSICPLFNILWTAFYLNQYVLGTYVEGPKNLIEPSATIWSHLTLSRFNLNKIWK